MSDDAVRYTFRWHVNDKNPDVRALLKVIKRERKEAADRIEADARRIAELEGLVKEAREVFAPLAAEKQCRCMYISRDTERAYENGTCPHQLARALLARMGGSDGSA
jgi:hypothetical protein